MTGDGSGTCVPDETECGQKAIVTEGVLETDSRKVDKVFQEDFAVEVSFGKTGPTVEKKEAKRYGVSLEEYLNKSLRYNPLSTCTTIKGVGSTFKEF